MIRYLLPWILASGLIGYLGRRRRFGFWGFFFFSLILSPVVGALSLFAAAPSRRSRDFAVASAARAALPAGSRLQRRAERLPRAGLGQLVAIWLGVILVFGVVYFLTGGVASGVVEATGFAALVEATELSLEVGTLGRAVALPHILTAIASVERIIVLVILVLMVARLVIARQTASLQEAREAAGRNQRRIDELEETLRAQQAAVATLGRVVPERAQVTEPAVPA